MRILLCVYITVGYDKLIWPLFSLFSVRYSGWKSHGLCPRLNYRHNWYTIQPGLLRVWHLFSFFLSCGSATGENYHYGQRHCQVRYCIWFSELHGACAQEEKRRFPSTPREQSINSFMFRKVWIQMFSLVLTVMICLVTLNEKKLGEDILVYLCTQQKSPQSNWFFRLGLRSHSTDSVSSVVLYISAMIKS